MESADTQRLSSMVSRGQVRDAHSEIKEILKERLDGDLLVLYFRTCTWLFQPIEVENLYHLEVEAWGEEAVLELASLSAYAFPQELCKEGTPKKLSQLEYCSSLGENLSEWDKERARWFCYSKARELGYKFSKPFSSLAEQPEPEISEWLDFIEAPDTSVDYLETLIDGLSDRLSDYPVYIHALETIVQNCSIDVLHRPEIEQHFSLDPITPYELLLRAQFLEKTKYKRESIALLRELVDQYPYADDARIFAIRILTIENKVSEAVPFVRNWPRWTSGTANDAHKYILLSCLDKGVSMPNIRDGNAEACLENPFAPRLFRDFGILSILMARLGLFLRVQKRRAELQTRVRHIIETAPLMAGLV